MAGIRQVPVGALDFERYREIADPSMMDEARRSARRMHELLAGRVVWHVNSTAVGGGVAEMLRWLIGYMRGFGLDCRWAVIDGDPEFFRITKRIHHAVHGVEGDGSPIDDGARAHYERTLRANAIGLGGLVHPHDIVILHDPQTAGLCAPLSASGAAIVWRCHIGCDGVNEHTDAAWEFLRPYLSSAVRYVFSRPEYVPDRIDPDRVAIIRPSIDAFAVKNRPLDADDVLSILIYTGLVEGPMPGDPDVTFERADGSIGRIERRADVLRHGRPPPADVPLAVQVSRWDRLKDPAGVIRGFGRLLDADAGIRAGLVLAGPTVTAVADDPEGPAVFREVMEQWCALPHAHRDSIHLVMLPTADIEENAIIVNALQRHAALVVQKSLREGFGLTVTEAMWKARPVIGSAVGGIRDQIEHGESGLLLEDPRDVDAFAAAAGRLLRDPEEAGRFGRAARERARVHFLGVRHLHDYARLLASVLGESN